MESLLEMQATNSGRTTSYNTRTSTRKPIQPVYSSKYAVLMKGGQLTG